MLAVCLDSIVWGPDFVPFRAVAVPWWLLLGASGFALTGYVLSAVFHGGNVDAPTPPRRQP